LLGVVGCPQAAILAGLLVPGASFEPPIWMIALIWMATAVPLERNALRTYATCRYNGGRIISAMSAPVPGTSLWVSSMPIFYGWLLFGDCHSLRGVRSICVATERAWGNILVERNINSGGLLPGGLGHTSRRQTQAQTTGAERDRLPTMYF